MNWSDYALGVFVLVCGIGLYLLLAVLGALVLALKEIKEQMVTLTGVGESIARSVDSGNRDEHKRIGFALEKIEAALNRAATTIERGLRE